MPMCVPPPDARQVILFANPRAGAGRGESAVREAQRLLESSRYDTIVLHHVDALVDAVAAALAKQTLRCVVVAGGDGTVQLIVNRVPSNTPLTIFPLGTENLLAKYCGMTADAHRVTQAVMRGRRLQMDLVRSGSQKFTLMAGCGFDAEVVHRLDASRTGPISHWSYAKPIWQTIRNYRYPEMRVIYEGPSSAGPTERHELTAQWVFVFNFPVYANGIPFARQADPADGLLDVCCFRGGGFGRGVFHLATIWSQRHGVWSGCHRFRVEKLRVEADVSVPVQFDGDPGGELPVEISVLPAALTLLVP